MLVHTLNHNITILHTAITHSTRLIATRALGHDLSYLNNGETHATPASVYVSRKRSVARSGRRRRGCGNSANQRVTTAARGASGIMS